MVIISIIFLSDLSSWYPTRTTHYFSIWTWFCWLL